MKTILLLSILCVFASSFPVETEEMCTSCVFMDFILPEDPKSLAEALKEFCPKLGENIQQQCARFIGPQSSEADLMKLRKILLQTLEGYCSNMCDL